MKTSNICLLSVLAGSIALSGCGQSTPTPTTITYGQVGICKKYETSGGTIAALPNEGFAIFKIDSVDNAKNNSLFNLDPERFYVDQSNAEQKKKSVYDWNRRFINRDPRFAQTFGVSNLQATSIQGGQKLDSNTFILIPVGIDNPTGGPEADQYNLQLVYDTGTAERGNIQSVSEGILFVRTNPADAKYQVVDDCKELPIKK
ncbi:MAG TPA: hypothetical protein VLZ74_09710 [Methylocella sp.]|nr:hypothetical protein [Methylocella sp.]